jgi:hypothetical protein
LWKTKAMQGSSSLDIYSYRCVCGQNSPSSQNLYESVVCQICMYRNHRSCYEQFLDDENFLCIRCRMEIWCPFLVIKKTLAESFNPLYNRIEQRIPFQLTREQISDINSGHLQLVIMCSVLKVTNQGVYEWPQRSFLISIKNDQKGG